MPAYSENDFHRIAGAIRVPRSVVQERASDFEAGARWFNLDRGIPVSGRASRGRPAPTARRVKMANIAKAARRVRKHLSAERLNEEALEKTFNQLLKHLTIENAAALPDGPADPDIFELLTYPERSDQDSVLALLSRLDGPDLADRIAALAEVERLAGAAALDAVRLGDLTVLKGNHGDRAVNGWLDNMLVLYEQLTGKKPGTSVRTQGPNEGVASGPLIRFLKAAGQPLGIHYDDDAWRSRVRTVLKGATERN